MIEQLQNGPTGCLKKCAFDAASFLEFQCLFETARAGFSERYGSFYLAHVQSDLKPPISNISNAMFPDELRIVVELTMPTSR